MRWSHLTSDSLGRARWILFINKSLLARGWHAATLKFILHAASDSVEYI